MTSREIEEHHLARIKQILSDNKITCTRSPLLSTESEDETEEELPEGLSEEAALVVEEENETLPEEQAEEEIGQEETSTPFPTPSLRKILPDRIRQLEPFNRIHVLPEEFHKNIDPLLIPRIAKTSPKDYIDILAELVGCVQYRSSLAEYWFLDTMANLLRRAQEDRFDKDAQAALMLWFCELMKEVQHFDAADRERFLRRIKENMLAAAEFVAQEESLPTPRDVGVSYRAPSEIEVEDGPQAEPEMKPLRVAFDVAAYECSVTNLTSILHYFYDLFSTDYQFELIRSIFTTTPEYLVIDASHQILTPKSLYTVAKPAKAKTKPAKTKEAKKGKEARSSVPDTEEFLRLMELQQREALELLAIEEREREDWERRTHILPLSFAIDDGFFLKHWPGAASVEKSSKKK